MPDLKHCVKRDGKMYCWDFDRRRPVEVVVRDVSVTPELMDIIGDIVALMSGQQVTEHET